MTKGPTGTLWLFSSDNRKLYVQDCLTVLALPPGALHRFRYQRKWISLGDGIETTDGLWEALVGIEVAVAFVAARSAAYGRAVIVPLRRGKVVRAIAEGDFLFVDFAVAEYLDVPDPADKSDRSARQAAVIQATDKLRSDLGERYPQADYGDGKSSAFSAVLSRATLPMEKQDGATATRRFTAAARILDDLLTRSSTASDEEDAKHPVFMRFLGVRRAWPANQSRLKVEKGAYALRAGTGYEVDTLEFSADSARGTVELALPPVLVAASELILPLASSYDMVTFGFVSAPKENDNRGEILAKINMEDSNIADAGVVRVRIPVMVRPRRMFTFLNWLVVGGSFLTALIVTMLASRGVLWAPPKGGSEYFATLLPYAGIYVAFSPVALVASLFAATVSGLAAAGAVFRRRFGLDSK